MALSAAASPARRCLRRPASPRACPACVPRPTVPYVDRACMLHTPSLAQYASALKLLPASSQPLLWAQPCSRALLSTYDAPPPYLCEAGTAPPLHPCPIYVLCCERSPLQSPSPLAADGAVEEFWLCFGIEIFARSPAPSIWKSCAHSCCSRAPACSHPCMLCSSLGARILLVFILTSPCGRTHFPCLPT